MGNKSNNDRSNSMNPNNPAYWASLRNHYSQIAERGGDGPGYLPLGGSIYPPELPLPHKPEPSDAEIPTLIIKPEPPNEIHLRFSELLRITGADF